MLVSKINKQWKKSQSRSGGTTQERMINGQVQYLTWVGDTKIFEKQQIINNQQYFVKKIVNFKSNKFFLELKNQKGKTFNKYYKTVQELNQELNKETILLSTFISKESEIKDDEKKFKLANLEQDQLTETVLENYYYAKLDFLNFTNQQIELEKNAQLNSQEVLLSEEEAACSF